MTTIYSDVEPFSSILLECYTFLLLQEFLMKPLAAALLLHDAETGLSHFEVWWGLRQKLQVAKAVLFQNPVTTGDLLSLRALSSAEASLCCGKAGEKEKESARGTKGRGERALAVSLFPSSPAHFLFFLLFKFWWGYPVGASAGERALRAQPWQNKV